MIKVGFVSIPESSGHTGRGIGVYTQCLFQSMQRMAYQYDIQVNEVSPDNIDSQNFKIIHYPYFDFFSHTLPVYHQPKFVVTIHDTIPLEYPDHYPSGLKGYLNLQLQKIALSNVSAVLTDSYASVSGIKKTLPVNDSLIHLIYLGPAQNLRPITDPAKLTLVKKKYKLPDKFVFYLGDINWNKNIPGLISACEEAKIALVIAGKAAVNIQELDFHHPELRHLKFLQNKFTTSEIFRLGFVPDSDLAAIFSLATLYCQPSYAEGFGLTILQALKGKCPVACSNTSSLPEIAGESAIYFDPHNPREITEAIRKLVTNITLRSSLVKSGIVQSEKFSWELTAQQTLSIYRRLA